MPATTKDGSPLAFTIARDKLSDGLAAVTPALAKQTTLPVLANILFQSTEKGLRLSGTDLDITIATTVPADIGEHGSMTVPAKRMLAIAKELPPSPVRMANGKQVVKVECSHSRYNLHSLPDDEFPQLPEVNYKGALRIAAGDLQALIAQTSFAAPKEENRPTLNGVLLQVDHDDDVYILRAVATNGHQLALAERRIAPSGMPFADAIVPTRALAQVSRLFEPEYELEVGRQENLLGIRSDVSSVITRLIEGPYPNYSNVIPKKHSREIVADRLALLHSVKRLVPVAAESTHRIILNFKAGEINLRAIAPDIGDGHDRVAVRFEGEELDIGVDASYLLAVLSALDSDEVRILTGNSVDAMVFKPVTRTDKRARVLYLLMPMRILD